MAIEDILGLRETTFYKNLYEEGSKTRIFSALGCLICSIAIAAISLYFLSIGLAHPNPYNLALIGNIVGGYVGLVFGLTMAGGGAFMLFRTLMEHYNNPLKHPHFPIHDPSRENDY